MNDRFRFKAVLHQDKYKEYKLEKFLKQKIFDVTSIDLSDENSTVTIIAEYPNGDWAIREIDEADIDLIQCTGLRDKNNKLIYEGDIIDLKTQCKWVVTWFRNRFILVPVDEYEDKDKYASDRRSGYKYFENNSRYAYERDEVIGNIYEYKKGKK